MQVKDKNRRTKDRFLTVSEVAELFSVARALRDQG
jgi:hypothetical protein